MKAKRSLFVQLIFSWLWHWKSVYWPLKIFIFHSSCSECIRRFDSQILLEYHKDEFDHWSEDDLPYDSEDDDFDSLREVMNDDPDDEPEYGPDEEEKEMLLWTTIQDQMIKKIRVQKSLLSTGLSSMSKAYQNHFKHIRNLWCSCNTYSCHDVEYRICYIKMCEKNLSSGIKGWARLWIFFSKMWPPQTFFRKPINNFGGGRRSRADSGASTIICEKTFRSD